MKPGDKVFVEVVIDQKVETHLGVYYIVHIDQYATSFTGHMISSISFHLIEDKNKIGVK